MGTNKDDNSLLGDIDCIKFLGQTGPDPKGEVELPNNRNTYVPLGQIMYRQKTCIQFFNNEYLVPNISNIRFKYLVECIRKPNDSNSTQRLNNNC